MGIEGGGGGSTEDLGQKKGVNINHTRSVDVKSNATKNVR